MRLIAVSKSEALTAMKAGRTVYMITPADLSISLSEYLTADFVIKEPDEDLSFAEMMGEELPPDELTDPVKG